MKASVKPATDVVVVLCTHNGAKWVEEQVWSLLTQTHPVAIRVFDDASTDETVARILACTEGQDVKCVVRDKAMGVVDNFATGIQSVLAENFSYIALADQDDVWEPNRIEAGLSVIQAAEKDPTSPAAQLAHSDLVMVNAHNHVIHRSFIRWRNYQTKPSNSLATILGQNGVMGNTILMNRSLAELALPFPDNLHVHDYWLALVAELLGTRHYIDEGLVHYRIHDGNVSNSAPTVHIGAKRWFKGLSIQRLKQRDFRLPFKEDSRLIAVQSLLNDPRFRGLNTEQMVTIEAFLDYLTFENSRPSIAANVVKHHFLRPGLLHRTRILVSILTSQRYENVNPRNS